MWEAVPEAATVDGGVVLGVSAALEDRLHSPGFIILISLICI